MYSPKIAEELIPDLYRIKKEKKTPMTGLVNWILKEYIRRWKREKNYSSLGRDGNARSA